MRKAYAGNYNGYCEGDAANAECRDLHNIKTARKLKNAFGDKIEQKDADYSAKSTKQR